MNIRILCPTTGYPMQAEYTARRVCFSVNTVHMWRCINNDPDNADYYRAMYNRTVAWFNARGRDDRRCGDIDAANRYMSMCGVQERFTIEEEVIV